MAEHRRSSGVFSRRLAVVNGGCCRPPARPRRYPVQSSLRRDPHTGVCVCKSGALPKNWRQPRPVTRPPRMQRKRRPRFLPALSLPAKSRCRCKSGQGTGDASREFFFFAQPSALFVAAPTTTTTTTTTTTAGPLSPPFLQPSKMAVRLIIFFFRHNSL